MTEPVENFAERALHLLELERLAERGSALTGRRSAIRSLWLAFDSGTCPGGGSVVALTRSNSHTLPSHTLTPHDEVHIKPSKAPDSSAPIASGVVRSVSDSCIRVIVESPPDSSRLGSTFRLERVANESAHKRLVSSVQRLRDDVTAKSHRLVRLLFTDGQSPQHPPTFHPDSPRWKPFHSSSGLNEKQVAAVDAVLRSNDLSLVHGPPGTGKTKVVVEAVAQEAERGHKVLVCGPSNVSVDNVVSRLRTARKSTRVVRIGHPARLLSEVEEVSLESLVMASEDAGLALDAANEKRAIQGKTAQKNRSNNRDTAKKEANALGKEAKNLYNRAVTRVLDDAEVVCSTLAGAINTVLREQRFDLVVIDEAAQALEASCWGALLKGQRAVLAGDHLQLPPTVLSDEAAKGALQQTLFERAHNLFGERAVTMLSVQYRMHASIMQWASDAMYGGSLEAAEECADRDFTCMTDVQTDHCEQLRSPLVMIDTAGEYREGVEDAGESKLNEGEAWAAIGYAKSLIVDGRVNPDDVGIIAPYSAQVAALRKRRAHLTSLNGLDIATVDGFQGREKEAIVVSLTRSSEKGGVGFVSDKRRSNVAATRARRQLALVCDCDTLKRDSFLKTLVEYVEKNGDYFIAEEFHDQAAAHVGDISEDGED